MKLVKLLLLFSFLVGCDANENDFVNPSVIKIYPDEQTNYSTYDILGLRETSDGGFLIFTMVTDFGNEPNHASVVKIDANGAYQNRVYVHAIDAHPMNIMETGNDNFEFICSSHQNNGQVLVKISASTDSISMTKESFDLNCRLEDCGMIFHALKRNGKYMTLNIGVDKIDGVEYNKTYIQQIDATNLASQEQISEQIFDPTEVLGISSGDYLGLIEFKDLFFIQDINGQLLYNAPLNNYIGLRYLNPNKLNIYSSKYFLLSELRKQTNDNKYSLILQDRNQFLPPYNTYLIENFDLSLQNDAGEIEDSVLVQDALGLLNDGIIQDDKFTCNNIYCSDYHQLDDINTQNKPIIRFDDTGTRYIGGTSQTGQVIIHHQGEGYTFGSGNPRYELADFLVTKDKVVMTGITTLQLNTKEVEGQRLLTNGKRAPFVIIVPKSEFNKMN